MSWIWLDGVETFERAKLIRTWKKWDSSFPLIYLIEFIAQSGAILLGRESDFEKDVIFTKIEKVEFLERPDAHIRLEIEVEPDGLRAEGGWFQGQILQEGKKILQGRVLLMNVGRLRPDGEGPVTFPQALIEALRHRDEVKSGR
ncbi:MAG: hypothetical protein HY447_00355 [Candidatus Omnitrophica bacterium]|nr:hypothetical protein [Candidatus Omnitrophota bacterium]